MKTDSPAQKTLERAVRLLAVRARTESELRKKLLEKGEPEDFIDEALRLLRERGYLDDARVARSAARSGLVGAKKSAARVRFELQRRGITKDTAQEALSEVQNDEGIDATTIAVQAAEKKLRSLQGKPPEEVRRKLYQYLARQGHPSDAIRNALRRVLSATPEEEPLANDEL